MRRAENQAPLHSFATNWLHDFATNWLYDLGFLSCTVGRMLQLSLASRALVSSAGCESTL